MKANVSKEELFILQKMIEGDEAAFKYFFDTYYDDLCNFVNAYLRDETLSEDIVQSIFVDLWERKSTLLESLSVKSYLYKASKNKSLNYIRNKSNRNRIEEMFLAQPDLSLASADQVLEFEELKQVINQAVESLPAQCKAIYKLSRDRELTNREIAGEMGISVKTVENQITIAIKKLRDFLNPYQDQIFLLFLFTYFFH